MKGYCIKEHRDEIVTHIIKQLIWVPIAAVIPMVGTLLKIIYNNIVSGHDNVWSTLLSVASTIISINCSVYIFRRNKKRELADEPEDMKASEEPEIVSKYKFSSVSAEMIFNTREDIISTIDYKMIILQDGVSELSRDLIWTGTTYNGTKLIQKNGNYDLIDSTRARSPYNYTIVLNEEKKPGEQIEFKTETSVTDGKCDMTPVYSFMVKYQIDELKLCIIAPKDLIKNVKSVVYADRSREIQVSPKKAIRCENVGNLRKYVYEIKNPNLLYNYFMEWEFTS